MKTYSIIVILVLSMVVAVPVLADGKWAGTEPGKGEGAPPEHAPVVENNDPDGGEDLNPDWNNGCGNEDSHADDDSLGQCGPDGCEAVIDPVMPEVPTESTPAQPITETVVTKPAMCKVIGIGQTVELFPADWSGEDESGLLGEASGRIEYTVPRGVTIVVFFWTPTYGHGPLAQRAKVTCDGDEIIVTERKVTTWQFQ